MNITIDHSDKDISVLSNSDSICNPCNLYKSIEPCSNNCPICFEDLEINNIDSNINSFEKANKSIIILRCRHKFHNECLIGWFKQTLGEKRSKRYCPYCRKKSSFIPLPPSMFPIKNIHAEYLTIEKYIYNKEYDKLETFVKPFFNENYCHSILKTGKNKGHQCTKKKIKNKFFCLTHSTKYDKIIDSII